MMFNLNELLTLAVVSLLVAIAPFIINNIRQVGKATAARIGWQRLGALEGIALMAVRSVEELARRSERVANVKMTAEEKLAAGADIVSRQLAKLVPGHPFTAQDIEDAIHAALQEFHKGFQEGAEETRKVA